MGFFGLSNSTQMRRNIINMLLSFPCIDFSIFSSQTIFPYVAGFKNEA